MENLLLIGVGLVGFMVILAISFGKLIGVFRKLAAYELNAEQTKAVASIYQWIGAGLTTFGISFAIKDGHFSVGLDGLQTDSVVSMIAGVTGNQKAPRIAWGFLHWTERIQGDKVSETSIILLIIMALGLLSAWWADTHRADRKDREDQSK